MIVRALACDYDGTVASGDRIGLPALAALERARAAGLRLVLLTGRSFFELTRVCERLDLFEAVVAENGAVLYFPGSGLLRDEAPAPAPRLLAELDRRGIAYRTGRVVIDAARTDEPQIREALAAAGVELECVYNRAALMLLPPGVSKGTGLRHVLRELGLSFHDVLGIGDAENDLSLLEACGLTACPADAVPAVQERADWILPGEDGAAIAAAIAGELLAGRCTAARARRHGIFLGWAGGTSEPVLVPSRGVNLLIFGDSLTGKSWLAGALVERLVARRYAVCVIDPEGDYQVLRRLPGVTGIDVTGARGLEAALAEFERDTAAGLVADLSSLPQDRKLAVAERGLARIAELRKRVGRPHWVVLDEAHYLFHAEGLPAEPLDAGAKGLCLTTYRPSWLRPSVVQAMDVFLLGRATDAGELAFLRGALGQLGADGARIVASLPDLPPRVFVLVQGRDAGRQAAVTFVPAPRETAHVRHLRKYADAVVPAERRFFFRRPDGALVATAHSLSAFREAVPEVGDAVLAFHAERGDFSRWVLGAFSDPTLAQHLRKLEARWRRGEVPDLRAALDRVIALRYGSP